MSYNNAPSPQRKPKTQPAPKFLIVVLLASFGVFYPYYRWNQQPYHEISMFILDKTVPNDGFRKHRGLMWVLNHFKIRHPGQTEPFKEDVDYFGFFPKPNHEWEIKALVDRPEGYDFMYVADTYGVYAADFYLRDARPTLSRKIYGGLEPSDVDVIERNLKRGATIVAEFNAFSEPTGPAARRRMSEVFDVKPTGWVGRFYMDLNNKLEIPDWALELYQRQYHHIWDFTGAGYLLVSRAGRIVILMDDVDTGPAGLTINFTKGQQEHYGVETAVQHTNWFDIVVPGKTTSVVATFNFDLNNSGLMLFKQEKIPTSFPAVLRHRTKDYLAYYFAGDFIDIDQVPFWYKMWDVPSYFKKLPMDAKSNPKAFYWKIFIPLLHTIVTEAIEQRDAHRSGGSTSLGRR